MREKYAAAARAVTEQQGSASCCGPISLTDADETHVFGAALYEDADADGATASAVAASLGCGVPTAVADLHEGETVLDLGSGAGADVLISARRVGPTGKAIGLDMTDEMLELARANAAQAGLGNVEFVKGFIEDIPLADASVDVIVSNCVLNLSGDKPKVLAEAARVLKPGGRFAVSDVIASPDMDAATRADLAAYTGCIAGALTEDEFRAGLEAAGFTDIEIRETHRVHEHASSAIIRARKPRTPLPASKSSRTESAEAMSTLNVINVTPETPIVARRIELFEPAMCCQSGVCGPSVDQQLIDVREDLRWAERQGAKRDPPQPLLGSRRVRRQPEGDRPDGRVRRDGAADAARRRRDRHPWPLPLARRARRPALSAGRARRRAACSPGPRAEPAGAADEPATLSTGCPRLTGLAGLRATCSSPARAASARRRPRARSRSRSPTPACARW